MKNIIKFIFVNGLIISSASLAMYGQGDNLRRAANLGNLEEVIALLAEGTPVNAKDKDGWTPLFCAVGWGHTEICQLLLEHEAQVNIKDSDGKTPLFCATENGYKDICQLLLMHNAQADAKTNTGWTALMWAAWQGDRKVCQLLIDANAQVYAKNAVGWTALICADRKNHHKICQLLIDAMLKHIKQNRARVIALLGIKKFNKAKCMNPIDRNVIQAIAHQIFDPAMTELCAQIDAIPNKKMRDEIRSYAQQQLKMKIDQDTNRDSHE